MTGDPLAPITKSLEADALVELFELDLSPIGVDDVWRFTPTPGPSGSVTFRGQIYVAADVKAEGFEVNGAGAPPQPALSVSNATDFLAGVVMAYADAVRCKVTRLRIFARFLDDGADPDPTAVFPPDVYLIEQKTRHDAEVIEWCLAAETDQEGVMLPKRTYVGEYCPWAYRRWRAADGAFDYSDVDCPYAGTAMFKADGTATTNPALDACGRKLDDCVDRFGKTADLPFGGFPGIAKAAPSSE